jgi:hypothetical protein
MTASGEPSQDVSMAAYLLYHRHLPAECPVAFAAWKGFPSPLRRQPVLSSCATGGHQLWWTVEVTSREAALALLPGYVAARTEAAEVGEVSVP